MSRNNFLQSSAMSRNNFRTCFRFHAASATQKTEFFHPICNFVFFFSFIFVAKKATHSENEMEKIALMFLFHFQSAIGGLARKLPSNAAFDVMMINNHKKNWFARRLFQKLNDRFEAINLRAPGWLPCPIRLTLPLNLFFYSLRNRPELLQLKSHKKPPKCSAKASWAS